MTQVLLDNCEDMAVWVPSVSSNWAIVPARTGNGFTVTGGTASVLTTLFPPATASDRVIIGLAYRVTHQTSVHEVLRVLCNQGVTHHNRLSTGPNGQINVTKGSAIIAQSATGLIAINTWNYLELRLYLHDSLGEIEVRLNGTVVIPTVTLDTKEGVGGPYDGLQLSGPGASMTAMFDDIYVLLGAGETFLGDQAVGGTALTGLRSARQVMRVLEPNPTPEPPLPARTHMLSRYQLRVLRSATSFEPTPSGNVKVWTGSAHANAQAKVWDGSQWKPGAWKAWDGATWKS